jgi:wyosine [tRNA(Phe)-imidazoG37] synthetase (radical SAM superfamily)
LGLNVIPFKTCTLDCVYCQCGRTTCKTTRRESFYRPADIIAAVRHAVAVSPRPDYLTFSGEGEPTLNSDLGRLVRQLKAAFRIPVAVITNSTLLTRADVRRELYAADLVVPSLDAADQQTFARVDRGHRGLQVADIIAGLRTFRQHYRGRLWLEILLCKDINDSPEHLVRLRHAVADIAPDRVQLNTVVRPPADAGIRPLSGDDLVQVQMLFGPNAQIAAPAQPERGPRRRALPDGTDEARVVALCSGRPVTARDIRQSLGLAPTSLRPMLTRLVRTERLGRQQHNGLSYYEARGPRSHQRPRRKH